MRIENFDKNVNYSLFEFVLIELCEKFLLNYYNNKSEYTYYYYTINKLKKVSITNINSFVLKFITWILLEYEELISIDFVIKNANNIIEKNSYLNKYSDVELYNHQKEIFCLFKKNINKDDYIDEYTKPKLVLYIAPTATGKTLTPIGLSEQYRIIFVCAARHVGLALAKSAISVGKKVALAFNCSQASDIRLNYAAGNTWFTHEFNEERGICSCGRKNCSKNGQYITYKDGSRKIDHSDGRAVEIIVCDIKSYTSAMYYMCAFNQKEDIITFWDEPTITMDEDEHSIHDIIKQNWDKNVIPNVILSSATLPKEHEIHDTIASYVSKFNGDVISITSHDCKKSIPIINKNSEIVVPHLLFKKYDELLECVNHCENYKTILRYFDLGEIVKFIIYVNNKKLIENERYFIERYFSSIDDVNMYNLKSYYLIVLKNINETEWETTYNYFKNKSNRLYESTSYFITSDAYTLTDGPSIFLAENIDKIAKFCVQQAKIPLQIMKEINESINFNNKLMEEILKIEKTFEDTIKDNDDEKTINKDSKDRLTKEQRVLRRKIDDLRASIKNIELNDIFIPNKKEHLNKWASDKKLSNPFTSNVSEPLVIKIMNLNNVDDIWKILLLMGIGVFVEHENGDYTQIMKDLAMNQHLYMIIASSNYIYGTNYQFCHGYLGKDLSTMTQEKLIQSMGRIGRQNMNRKYSFRLRDNELIEKIYLKSETNIELDNMNKLFIV